MTAFDVYLLQIEKPADLAQLWEAVRDEVQTEWFSPILANNSVLIVKSSVFGDIILPGMSARQKLVSTIRERLERRGYSRQDGWTPDQIQDLEDVWERHKYD